jgi:hypothetical protein
VTGPFSFDGRGGDDRSPAESSGDTLLGGSGNDQIFGNQRQRHAQRRNPATTRSTGGDGQ